MPLLLLVEAYNAGMSADRFSHLLLGMQFVVWVVYGFLAALRHWPAGVAFGVLASIGLLSLEASRHIKVKLLDWVLLGYFVIAAIATFLIRSAAFPAYSSVVIWALYAGVTWVSIIVGVPFSLQYARESAPPESWNTLGFLHANWVISMVWGLAFSVNIVLASIALNPRNKPLVVGVLVPLLIMGGTGVFTARYTKITRQRAGRA
jgi:hypothetical protein